MSEQDRFEPLRCEDASAQELRLAMQHGRADPFAELASGDRSRARTVLLAIGARFTTLTPFMVEDGLTLLHFAARFDLRQAAATLLAWGVQVDALTWPHRDVGSLWAKLGAGLPVSIVGEQGLGVRALSPLHLAVLANHEAMVEFLLRHGANPRRNVALDHGIEGIEPATMADLIDAAAGGRSRVAALLHEAQLHAPEPTSNGWLDTGLPRFVMQKLWRDA